MAQGDIVDLDAFLFGGLESQIDIDKREALANRQKAQATDLEMLGQYGYESLVPTPGKSLSGMTMGGFGPAGAAGMLAYDQRRKEEAMRKGILADDPYALENWKDQVDPTVLSEYAGVDVTGAAKGDVIKQLELLPSLKQDDYTESVERILQNNYKEEFDIPRTYDYNVRVDPNAPDRLIFNDPLNDNKPTYIDPPGIDRGNFQAFVDPLMYEIVGGIVGGLGGSLVGPKGTIAGAVGGETLGTFIGRYLNLLDLDSKGVLPDDYTQTDILAEAMKDAGMTAGFALGGVGLFKIIKKVIGVSNLPNKLMLDEEEFLESYAKLQEVGEDVSAMTSSQVLIRSVDEGVNVRSPAEEVEAMLRDEAKVGSEQGKRLREKYVRQEEIGREEVGEAFGTRGITPELVDVEAEAATRVVRGREARNIAQESLETNPRLRIAEENLTELNTQSDTIFRDLTNGALDPNAAGKQIRETFQAAKNNAEAAVDAKYDEAAELAGFKGNVKPYNYTPLTKPATRLKNILDQQAFADPKNKRLVQGVLESIEGGPNKPHAVFINDLSNLRSIIRAERALGSNVDELVTLQKTMESIRAKTLKEKGTPNALKAFEEAEFAYREKMENFNNDLLKRMLDFQTVSNTAYKQGDKLAYQGFMGFLRNNLTKNADGTISSPQYIDDVVLDPTNADGLLGIKGGLRQSYLDEVVDTTTDPNILRPKTPRAHETFMQKNRTLMEKFFTEDEMAEFANAGQFISAFKAKELALTKARTAILKNTSLADIAGNFKTPEDLFKNTWSPGRISATSELYKAITESGSKDLLDAYKAYIFKDLMDSTQRPGTLGKNIFDGRSIDSYLDDHGDAMELWFGKTFRTQLSGIAKKLKALDDPTVPALRGEENFALKSANSLARAYVGIFTTPGRVLTAVKNIVGGVQTNKELQLLTDPDKLYDAIIKDKWQRNPVVKGAVRALGRIYYREDDPELEPEVTAAETLLLGPGFQEDQFKALNMGGHVIKNLGVPLRYGYGD